MTSNGLEQQQTLNLESSLKPHNRRGLRGSPKSPRKRRVRIEFGSPDEASPVRELDFGSPDEGSPVGELDFGSPQKRDFPSKRSPNKKGYPTRSPYESPKKQAPPSKKHHIPYSGIGSFTPIVEKLDEDNGKTVKKIVYVYMGGMKAIDKRRFELRNPSIRPISYNDWFEMKKTHERTDVPNVVRTVPITETDDNGVLKCEIKMERVKTLFEVLPTLTSEERQQLSCKLWNALCEINAHLSKEGLCLNDPALNWGLDEDGNIKFFDLLFSKKMTIASGFKFGYEDETVLSVDDERKIVQLRAFVLMVLFVENFEETQSRLDFENLIRKFYVENNVGDMSIAELEAFLNSRL